MLIFYVLHLLAVESLCGWLSGHFYKDDNFLGYQSDVGDIIQTYSDLTLMHCSVFCVGIVTPCQSFFHDSDSKVCTLLKRIPTIPSGARQPASENVLYSPNRQGTTASITTAISTSVGTCSGVRNVSGCLSLPSEYHVEMWDLNKYLVLIGPTTVSIDEANLTCTCLGGYLIILQDQAKFDYFRNYLDVHVSESCKVIIGLRADHYMGPWLWPSGSYLNNTPAFCTYEPSGDLAHVYVERCAVLLHPSGCMDDRNCPVAISPVYFACDVF